MNIQGEFLWQRSGEGRVYDLGFSEDGKTLYAVGRSENSPLLMVIDAVSGKRKFHANGFHGDKGFIYKQVMVTEGGIVIALNDEKIGSWKLIKWKEIYKPLIHDNGWVIDSQFCFDCENQLAGSVALQKAPTVNRFFLISSSNKRLELSVRDTKTGHKISVRSTRALGTPVVWNRVVHFSGSSLLDKKHRTLLRHNEQTLFVSTDDCNVFVATSDSPDLLSIDLCGQVKQHRIGRKILQSNNASSSKDQEISFVEQRAFMFLEWGLGIGTGIGFVAGVYAFIKWLIHLKEKRTERFETLNRIEKDRRFHNKKKLDSLQDYKPIFHFYPDFSGSTSASLFPVNFKSISEYEAVRDNRQVNLFFKAVQTYDIGTVDHFLAKSANLVNEKDEYGNSALHLAIYNSTGTSEDYELIGLLLRFNANPKETTNQGVTPLQLAASKGDSRLFKLVYNAMPSIEHEEISILLHIAAQNGHTDILRNLRLLQPSGQLQLQSFSVKSSQLSSISFGGSTILHEAVCSGNLSTVSFILDNFISNINLTDDSGNTPLHVAAQNSNPNSSDIIRLLVRKGGNLKLTNNLEQTPLHVALQQRNENSVETILSLQNNGFDIPNSYGMRPLHLAYETKSSHLNKISKKREGNVRDKFERYPLHYAALSDFPRAFEDIQYETDINSTDKDGNTPLHLAIQNGSSRFVRKILQNHNINIRIKNKNEKTAFELATELNHQDIIKMLDEHIGVAQSSANDSDAFLVGVHSAAELGDLNKVLKYLTSGGNIDSSLFGGFTLLHMASKGGNVEVVELLISKKATIDAKTDSGNTPLHFSLMNGNMQVAAKLVEEGADINAPNSLGNTAFHIAAIEGNTEALQYLIQNSDSGVGLANLNGNSALHLAAAEGNLEAGQFLISVTEANIKNLQGNTPLHLAAAGGHLEVLRQLIPIIKPSIANAQGNTPLHLAATEGHSEIVNQLLSVVDSHVENHQGNTPLHLAVLSGHLDATKLLINYRRTDINSLNGGGYTPLHLAIFQNDTRLVSYILGEKELQIDTPSSSGDTALHWASFLGLEKIIIMLVENEADLNAMTGTGLSAMMLAVQTHSRSTINTLKELHRKARLKKPMTQ